MITFDPDNRLAFLRFSPLLAFTVMIQKEIADEIGMGGGGLRPVIDAVNTY